MVDPLVPLVHHANHVIITTLPSRPGGTSGQIPALIARIRSRYGAKGARVLSLDSFVSNDARLTWKSTCTFDGATTACQVGDSLHYAEVVRNWIADNVVQIMIATP